MDVQADFRLSGPADARVAVLSGDWTTHCIQDAGVRLASTLKTDPAKQIDLSAVKRCDTAGSLAVINAAKVSDAAIKARPETERLMELVRDALGRETPIPKKRMGLINLFDRLGRGVFSFFGEVVGIFDFIGHLMLSLARAAARPDKIRWAPVVNLCERAGLDAIPVVVTTAIFIGAVVALLGINSLQQFGAQVLVVETIGIAVLREFGIVITAVLLAGRSASSFAAEIGAMKMNQEIDAMQVLGVDPYDALVLPRFVALLLMLPLLTFAADLAGLAGGLMVSWGVLDLSPTFFLQRIVENVGQTHFWVGLSKAPVMAGVVAVIGCRQGMSVEGDVESLGRKVTAAVVQAIFAIILIDAIFALIFMVLDV
jgi:phospholipid/cholesterol/gamma-HCH transport system permease protein